MTITYRNVKGSALTYSELDANFTDLDGRVTTLETGKRVFIEELTASASASLDFDTSTFDDYQFLEFEIINVLPATSAANFNIRFSTDAGASYISSGDYFYANILAAVSGPAPSQTASATASAGVLATNCSNSTGAINGIVRMTRENGALSYTLGYVNSGGNWGISTGVGARYGSTYNAVRFLCSSGNITSGKIRLYGIV
jgi:hypothetical protein